MKFRSKVPFHATSIRELESLGFDPTRPLARSHVPSPIVPVVIATAVVQEASAFLQHALPSEWSTILIFHAETICAHNRRFRRRLNTRGNTGRDRLWSFMRHWLTAMIASKFPNLSPLLPSEYKIGHPLPAP